MCWFIRANCPRAGNDDDMNGVWTRPIADDETVGCLVADRRGVVFAGTASGLRSSRDGGRTWRIHSDESPAAIEAIAVSANALYAGGSSGLYRSTDAGRSWQRLLETHVHAVLAWENPDMEDLIVAGTEWDGALRSQNGGLSWESANPGLLDTTVISLALDGRLLLAGTLSGIYLSRNAGKAWRMSATPFEEAAVQCLAMPSSRLALAGTEDAGLFRSENGGSTWTAIPDFAGYGIGAIAVSDATIAIATGHSVLLSGDAGQTWNAFPDTPGEIAALHLSGGILLSGLYDGGIARLEIEPPIVS
jgi:photosystem II stability/assembly factor-like uncharacterized protein